MILHQLDELLYCLSLGAADATTAYYAGMPHGMLELMSAKLVEEMVYSLHAC